VRLRPTMTGICGSDLGYVYFKSATTLSAYGSYPFVPGHEVLAIVTDVGRDVRSVKEGDRVVVDPWLRCDLRAKKDCARCTRGEYNTCERHGTGPRKGMMIGACAELPGGFGESMVAHESQLFVVSSSVVDERAVLTEPIAVGVHAVLRNQPKKGEHALVIGGGAVAFSTLFALRETTPDTDVTHFTLEAGQDELASLLGADRTWTPGGEELVDRAARLTNATPIAPDIGSRFLVGGFDVVFDCVGSARSLEDAMRLVRAGGTVVMVGAAAVMRKLDLTHLWTKEIRLVGTLAYCSDPWKAGTARTFAITRELLEGTARPVERLVTHRHRLDEVQIALRANLHRSESRAIKTVLVV
jgi:threonine dehydrogenase-like Zn-dependent dehydrogenase